MAQWPVFTLAAREWRLLSPAVQAAYSSTAQHAGLNGRDMQIRSYLQGMYEWSLP